MKTDNFKVYSFGNCKKCSQKNVPINQHHTPIFKSKGGKKTIEICLNCHYKEHYISNCIQIIDLRGCPICGKKHLPQYHSYNRIIKSLTNNNNITRIINKNKKQTFYENLLKPQNTKPKNWLRDTLGAINERQ